jgi:segregation and condensation protein A
MPNRPVTAEPPEAPEDEKPWAGEGGSPRLAIEGFAGPLEQLLLLARAHKIDLGSVSLVALVDQLTGALRKSSKRIPLGQKADWVVMAAWLLQLRSLLLLPAGAPEQQAATVEANQLRGQLQALAETQALARWLQARPQVGFEVFARGQPEIFGVAVDATEAVDVIEFLWASLALFNDPDAAVETKEIYRPPGNHDLYTVAEARDRILLRLSELPDGAPLNQLLPAPDASVDAAPPTALRRRSAWSSTLIASLELARQGEVALQQERDFQPIHLAPVKCSC